MASPKHGRKYSFQTEKFLKPPGAPRASEEVQKRFSLGSNDEPQLRLQTPPTTLPPPRLSIAQLPNLSFHKCHSIDMGGGGGAGGMWPGGSLTPSSGEMCRICLQTDCPDSPTTTAGTTAAATADSLISPCFCKGSHGLIHRSCLRRWVTLSGKYYCEICHFNYITEERVPRVSTWIRRLLMRRIAKDLLAALLLVVYTGLLLVFCFNQVMSDDISAGNMAAYVSCVIVACGALMTWLVLTGRGHVSSFKKYKKIRRRRTIRQPKSILIQREHSTTLDGLGMGAAGGCLQVITEQMENADA